jgi:NAD(P)-dependent dehydrogenase (short-subunit alcohol dehydrogenase family)
MNSDRLTNKVAIVTGASRGIGSAIATNLARNGAKVVLAARDARKLEEVVNHLRQSGNEGMVLGITIAETERLIVRDEKVSRLGEPEDIAHLVTFVVSPEGRFLHGSLIDMDGGQTKTI